MQDRVAELNTSLAPVAASRPDGWQLSACGVSPGVLPIPALLDKDAYVPTTDRLRVLLISGLSGEESDVLLALGGLELFRGEGNLLAARIALTAVPCGNPEGTRDLSTGYPPQDNFFNDPKHRNPIFVAVGMLSSPLPGTGGTCRRIGAVASQRPAGGLVSALGGTTNLAGDGSLLAALGTGAPDGLGTIPGLRLTSPPEHLATELGRLFSLMEGRVDSVSVSPARRALNARRTRSYVVVAQILASVYGHQLDPVNYTQGVGISGRLRLARLDQDEESPASGIARLVEPYVCGSVPCSVKRPGAPTWRA